MYTLFEFFWFLVCGLDVRRTDISLLLTAPFSVVCGLESVTQKEPPSDVILVANCWRLLTVVLLCRRRIIS